MMRYLHFSRSLSHLHTHFSIINFVETSRSKMNENKKIKKLKITIKVKLNMKTEKYNHEVSLKTFPTIHFKIQFFLSIASNGNEQILNTIIFFHSHFYFVVIIPYTYINVLDAKSQYIWIERASSVVLSIALSHEKSLTKIIISLSFITFCFTLYSQSNQFLPALNLASTNFHCLITGKY